MPKPRILTLPIHAQWFILILNQIKLEEYREIKPYYQSRLIGVDQKPIHFDVIRFVNGYRAHRPTLEFEHILTDIGKGKIEWGAPQEKEVFRIKLGNLLSVSYVKPSMYVK